MEMKIMIHGASHGQEKKNGFFLSNNQLALLCNMRKTNINGVYLLRASWVIDFIFGVMEHVFYAERTI